VSSPHPACLVREARRGSLERQRVAAGPHPLALVVAGQRVTRPPGRVSYLWRQARRIVLALLDDEPRGSEDVDALGAGLLAPGVFAAVAAGEGEPPSLGIPDFVP